MNRINVTLALAALLIPSVVAAEEGGLTDEELLALELQFKYTDRTVPWNAESPLFHPEKEWRPYVHLRTYPRSTLYALPDHKADHVAELKNPTQAEIIDGKSIYTDFGDPETKGGGLLYVTWIKIAAGDVEGWVHVYDVSDDGDEAIQALVYFEDDCGPVREGPSDDAPVARREVAEVMFSENWLIGPEIPAGALYFAACRVGNWYCVGSTGSGDGWVYYDPELMDFYIPAHMWTARAFGKELDIRFYFPIEDEINKIIMETNTWATCDSIEDDGLLTLRTTKGVFELRPRKRPGGLGHENYGEYYEIDLPTTITPGDIESADFSFKLEDEEIEFSFDPTLSWEGRNGDD